MSKRRRASEEDEVTRDTPIKIDLPFDEAARRLARSRDDQATSDEESDSDEVGR